MKYFDTNTGRKYAVDGLNLTMYSGQITALLGHNGAGKTTTISMLTGLIAPDGGTAFIAGHDVLENMEEIRRNLGVCPQHDILFPDLTVEEHLTMFASFKGVPSKECKQEVENMIQSVGLTEKRKIRSKFLSGGQKRKLSVGIAFIGGSKVVFLDEPTSGMDPYSRRFTWNVIRQHKEGRVIVLTTHFMDEADMLGDRIAIMGDGKLQCCGSSLFLKNLFGVGYSMVVEKNDPIKFNSTEVKNVVTSHVPSAKVLTDVGAELTFQLPLSSSEKFQGLFNFMDANQSSLGIRSYGMSVTTLEEVFIRVAEGTTTESKSIEGRHQDNHRAEQDEESGLKLIDFTKLRDEDSVGFFFKHMFALIMKRFLYFKRDVRTIIYQFVLPVIFVLVGMIIMYVTSPVTYQPSIALNSNMFNPGISVNHLPTPYADSPVFCIAPPTNCAYGLAGQSNVMTNVPGSSTFPVIPLTTNAFQSPKFRAFSLSSSNLTSNSSYLSVQSVSEYLYLNRNNYQASQFGAVSFTALNASKGGMTYIVHANYTGVHASALFAAFAVEGFLTSIDSSAALNLNIFPLPATYKQQTILNNYNLSTVIYFILIAISFVAAGLITFIMREREVRAKAQQMVSGVSVLSYWLSTWIS